VLGVPARVRTAAQLGVAAQVVCGVAAQVVGWRRRLWGGGAGSGAVRVWRRSLWGGGSRCSRGVRLGLSLIGRRGVGLVRDGDLDGRRGSGLVVGGGDGHGFVGDVAALRLKIIQCPARSWSGGSAVPRHHSCGMAWLPGLESAATGYDRVLLLRAGHTRAKFTHCSGSKRTSVELFCEVNPRSDEGP
jgi:hypothetical protein